MLVATPVTVPMEQSCALDDRNVPQASYVLYIFIKLHKSHTQQQHIALTDTAPWALLHRLEMKDNPKCSVCQCNALVQGRTF
jgi:hypothetical protein